MSVFSDFLGVVRQVMLIEDRLTRLGATLATVEERQSDMRDRLVRVESILEIAMRAGERRIGD